MIRTTLRRAGVLAATTALAGATFAGSALAGQSSEEDVTAAGGPGGGGGDNTVQCVASVPIASNDLAGVLLSLTGALGNTNDTATATSCSPTSVGGAGGSANAGD